MQRTLFIFGILVTLLSGCGDDDSPPNPVNQNVLVGTWRMDELLIDGSSANPSGTITFSADGTGKENYNFSVSGIPQFENDEFTWESTDTSITFDKDTSFETVWAREVNEAKLQRGSYNFSIGIGTVTSTVTLVR